MKKTNILKQSDRTYMMARALNDDFLPCYRIVVDVQKDDLTKNYLEFKPSQIFVQEDDEGLELIPVKLNWTFLTSVKKDYGWLVPVIDSISPRSELEIFQALSYFFARVNQHLSRSN